MRIIEELIDIWLNKVCDIFTIIQTIIGREQSDLINNTTHCHTDYCRKGAQQPDLQ